MSNDQTQTSAKDNRPAVEDNAYGRFILRKRAAFDGAKMTMEEIKRLGAVQNDTFQRPMQELNTVMSGWKENPTDDGPSAKADELVKAAVDAFNALLTAAPVATEDATTSAS